MNHTLRPYQTEAVASVRTACKAGHRAPLLVLSTGGGKTFIFCYIAESVRARGKRVLILVHRQELLRQTSEQLSDLDVQHGIISPGHSMTGDPVQVASVQTLVRRLDKIPEPDLIIIDEAHHSGAASWGKIIKHWPNALLLGVTATPCRLDGKGLGVKSGGFYDELTEGPNIRWLIDNGFLSQPIVYAPPSGLDLEGVKTIVGDYDKKEVRNRVDKPSITGCAVDHYQRLCPGVPAIAFCASVVHAEHVAQQFNDAGIPAASLDGKMADTVRKARIADLGSGRIKLLASCDIISEGTDIPVVTTAILLRPTKSMGLFLQQVGRCLRPFPGKKNAIVLDHVGNCLRHGLPDDVRSWSLAGYRGASKKKDGENILLKVCPQCYAIYSRVVKACPQCGHIITTAASRDPKQVAGQLRMITRSAGGGGVTPAQKKYTKPDWDQLRRLLAESHARGLPKSAAFRMFHRLKGKGLLHVA